MSTLQCADCGAVLARFREEDAEAAEKLAATHQCTTQITVNARIDLESLLHAIENAERLEPRRIDGKLYEVVRTVDFECFRIYAKKVRAAL